MSLASRAQPSVGRDAKTLTSSGRVAVRPQPIRVMHVLDRLDIGGTEKALLKLINGLDAGLFEHYICTMRGTSAAVEKWTSNVTLLNAGKQGASFQFNVPRLVKLMRTIRPAIVHSRNWGGIEATVAARLAGVPVALHSEHGYELEMRSGLPLQRRLLRHLAYRMATAVATVTCELRDYHAAQAWWASERMHVLYNGVDGRQFRPQPAVRSATRRELGISPNALVAGSVGRMVRLKSFITLLEAAKGLATEFPELYVILAGSGPELSSLQDFAANCHELSGRVVFTGTIDNVADVLNAMDVFVLPTLMEGMSNTILEALAVGLPVLASRVGGNPELVEEGVCGYLFTPEDVPGLASLLRTLLRNSSMRAEFCRAARERALRSFSLEAMVRSYGDLYIDLLMRQRAIVATTSYVRD